MNFGVVSMPPVLLHPRVGNMPLAKARIKIYKHPKYCTKKNCRSQNDIRTLYHLKFVF
jgi:hypothetical protein